MSVMDQNSSNVYWIKTKSKRRLMPRQSSSKKLIDFKQKDDKKTLELASFPSSTSQKLTFKDLCDEDKLRIANLIKELAKLGEEKESVSKTLEDERKNYEAHIEIIKKQQELVLEEKDQLLKKFIETEKKLAKVNEEKSKSEHSIKKKSKNRSKELLLLQPKNFVSSTPLNASLRCVSPITNENAKFTQDIDNQIKAFKNKDEIQPLLHSTLNTIDDPDSRKHELINERVRLMSEQNNLRKLIEQQEKLLQEKHAQIMFQQQIHKERLIQMKLSNEQRPIASQSPPEVPLDINRHQPNALNEQNFEFIQEKPQPNLKANLSLSSIKSNRSEIKQENSLLIDLLIENERKETAMRRGIEMRTKQDEDDDSQLIEEIFFSKKISFS